MFSARRIRPAIVVVAVVVGAAAIAPADRASAAVANPFISAGPDVVVSEGDGFVDLPVTLNAPGTGSVSVHIFTADAGAKGSGSLGCSTYDYKSIVSSDLTFLPGDVEETVRVDIHNCADVEGLESFLLTLSIPNGGTIARFSTRVTIVDNDATVAAATFVIRDAVVDEKAGTADVPVMLGGPAGAAWASTVSVDYTTGDGTAIAPGDYTTTTGTLSFVPGSTVGHIIVPIIDAGAAAEPAERFSITLSNPAGATILDANGTVVIAANDAAAKAAPAISAGSDVVVSEADGYVDVPITLDAPGTGPVSVHFFTVNAGASGSGINGCPTYDYISVVSDNLTFLPGETARTVRIDIHDCVGDVEGLESFILRLAAPVTGGTVARFDATVGIVDNDGTAAILSWGISNDAYTVTSATDKVLENPGGGTDTVSTSLSYTLGANLENLVLTGAAAVNGTGNSLNNAITGNAAANKLSGLAGSDNLKGGLGGDTLTGGPNGDSLTGGAGLDFFVLNSLTGSDTVTDFSRVDDTFRISQAGIRIGNGDSVVNGASTRGVTGGFARTAELIVFTSNISGPITAAKAAAKIGSAATAYATGNTRLFVVDNGTSTGIFRFRSSGANRLVSPAELTLVALVKYASGTTTTATNDYTFIP